MSRFMCRVLYRPSLGLRAVKAGSYARAAIAVYAHLLSTQPELIDASLTIEVESPTCISRRFRVGISAERVAGEWTR